MVHFWEGQSTNREEESLKGKREEKEGASFRR